MFAGPVGKEKTMCGKEAAGATLILALILAFAVSFGQASAQVAARQQVLDAAYFAHPERFVRGRPTSPPAPTAVWMNPPSRVQDTGPREVSTASDTSTIAP